MKLVHSHFSTRTSAKHQFTFSTEKGNAKLTVTLSSKLNNEGTLILFWKVKFIGPPLLYYSIDVGKDDELRCDQLEFTHHPSNDIIAFSSFFIGVSTTSSVSSQEF